MKQRYWGVSQNGTGRVLIDSAPATAGSKTPTTMTLEPFAVLWQGLDGQSVAHRLGQVSIHACWQHVVVAQSFDGAGC